MAKGLSRKELKKRFGISDAHISVYVKRGKLVPNEAGLFDFDNPQNALYATTRELKATTAIDGAEAATQAGDLMQKKIQADTLRIESVTELNRIRIQKIEGEVLPTDLVQPIFIMFTKAIQTAFADEAEDIVRDVSHAAKLSKQQMADLRKRIVEAVNRATEKGVKDGKSEVKKVANTYSDTRERGERG